MPANSSGGVLRAGVPANSSGGVLEEDGGT